MVSLSVQSAKRRRQNLEGDIGVPGSLNDNLAARFLYFVNVVVNREGSLEHDCQAASAGLVPETFHAALHIDWHVEIYPLVRAGSFRSGHLLSLADHRTRDAEDGNSRKARVLEAA